MFANNVGAGTTTVLDTTNLTLSSTGSGDPRPFDIVIPLTTPFLYDPAQGDLLMDIFMRNSPATRQFDVANQTQQTVTRRISATDINATSGSIDSNYLGLVTRFDMAADEDWYSFNVATPGQSVWLETSTFADGPGQFNNTLNPRLELFDPSNTLVASGSPMADGRNEFIQHQTLVPGTYCVRVAAQGGTTGEYALTKNVGPAIVDLAVNSPIDENGVATLIATIDDPDSNDSHTVVIAWGSGEGSTTFDLPPGVLSFSVTHQYLDDNLALTPSDNYPIGVTVIDSRGASAAGSTAVTVENVAPVIDGLAATSVDENGVVHLTGTYHDVGTLDTHTLTIDWGDGVEQTVIVSGGLFDVTHPYEDDNPTATASDAYTISVALADDDGGTTTTTISNVTPSNVALNSGTINENNSFLLTGSFEDAGAQDTHTVIIDWGDGSAPTTIELQASLLAFSAVHQYLDDNPTGTPADDYTITVTVTSQ